MGIREEFDARLLEAEYAAYILDNSPGDRLICNGDDLIGAMESGYMADDFFDSMEVHDEGI